MPERGSIRPVNPDAEAGRLAHARVPDPDRTVATGACAEDGCWQANANGVPYVARLIDEADRHAAVHGHTVRIEVQSAPVVRSAPATGFLP